MKREHGEDDPIEAETVAAPATVSACRSSPHRPSGRSTGRRAARAGILTLLALALVAAALGLGAAVGETRIPFGTVAATVANRLWGGGGVDPTNHLDIEHQLGLLALARSLGVTVLAALHDLNHAAMFADRIAVLRNGRLAALGTPSDVLVPERLRALFGVEAETDRGPDGRPRIRYRRPGARARPFALEL